MPCGFNPLNPRIHAPRPALESCGTPRASIFGRWAGRLSRDRSAEAAFPYMQTAWAEDLARHRRRRAGVHPFQRTSARASSRKNRTPTSSWRDSDVAAEIVRNDPAKASSMGVSSGASPSDYCQNGRHAAERRILTFARHRRAVPMVVACSRRKARRWHPKNSWKGGGCCIFFYSNKNPTRRQAFFIFIPKWRISSQPMTSCTSPCKRSISRS
jgi:hypothetical protein